MHLNHINILKDIKALSTCTFPKLIKLIIEGSDLGNDCIDVIKHLILPEVKYISLFDNKISSPKIFEALQHFYNLEIFFIGHNQIKVNDLENKNCKYIFPPNLRELGMSEKVNKLNISNIII